MKNIRDHNNDFYIFCEGVVTGVIWTCGIAIITGCIMILVTM